MKNITDIPKICITPYIELMCGNKSIYNYTKINYTVSDKVIQYLQIPNMYYVSPGVYTHPFKSNITLFGPYTYTDGHYYWDRDTWKYVLKYGLLLPERFINHVMSEKGTEYLKQQLGTYYTLKTHEDLLNLPPTDCGDIPYCKF